MKKIGEGIKSAALTGLFTILPILLLYLLLAEIFQLLVALATPLADIIFPPDALKISRRRCCWPSSFFS